jgi:hypothetical protein
VADLGDVAVEIAEQRLRRLVHPFGSHNLLAEFEWVHEVG